MPQNLGPAVLATAFSLTSLSTIVIALRFYCRHFLLRAVKIYDHLMLVAVILTWGISVTNYYQVKVGTGTRMGDQDLASMERPRLEAIIKSSYAFHIIYLVALCVVKLSILTFYRVISSHRNYRIAVHAVMGIVTAFTIAMVIVNAFECPDISNGWPIEILFGDIDDYGIIAEIYYSQAAFNILSDIIILLLPMPVLSALQLGQRKRIALIGIFSVGFIAVLASALRIYALSLWDSPDADLPYAQGHILIWSQIEVNAAIISASAPSLKPLFSRVFAGSSAKTRTPQYGDPNRSYGNMNASRQNAFRAYGNCGQDFSVTATFNQLKDDDGGTVMELHDLRNISKKRSCNSDEEGILDVLEEHDLPSQHMRHPNAAATQPERNPGAGIHVMRSITVETSSWPR